MTTHPTGGKRETGYSTPLHIQEGYGEPWRAWFAWYPVRVEHRLVWLRWIECRWFHCALWFCVHGFWEYRRAALGAKS